MKILKWFTAMVIFGLMAVATFTGRGEPVQFLSGVILQAGAANLQPGTYAIPLDTDWNDRGQIAP